MRVPAYRHRFKEGPSVQASLPLGVMRVQVGHNKFTYSCHTILRNADTISILILITSLQTTLNLPIGKSHLKNETFFKCKAFSAQLYKNNHPA